MRISDWSSDVCSSDLGNVVLDARREEAGQLRQLLAHRIGGGQRIAGGRELHADGGARLTIQPAGEVVAHAADLDVRDVAQTHAGAAGGRARSEGTRLNSSH